MVFSKKSLSASLTGNALRSEKIIDYIKQDRWKEALVTLHYFIQERLDEQKLLMNQKEFYNLLINFRSCPNKRIVSFFNELTSFMEQRKNSNSDLLGFLQKKSNRFQILLQKQLYLNETDMQVRLDQSQMKVTYEEKILEHDRETIEKLVSQKKFFEEAFENIFKRSDLSIEEIHSLRISYLNEGAFKRVYRIVMITEEEYQYQFLVKIIKEDVQKSDTGYVYDFDYIKKYLDVVKSAREIDFSLHLPLGGIYLLEDTSAGKRMAYTEAYLPSIQISLSEELKGRITLAAYLRHWLAFDKKIYFDDPKYQNVIIQKIGEKFRARIIDFDNIEYGNRIGAYQLVEAFLLHGFTTAEITLAVIDALPEEEAKLFINDVCFMLRNLSQKSEADEIREFYEISKEEEKYLIPIIPTKPIHLTVNGIPFKSKQQISLLELTQDCFLDPQNIFIIFNGKKYNLNSSESNQYLFSTILKDGDEISFYDKTKTEKI